MSSFIIVPGRNYFEESNELAEKLGCKILSVKYKVFPDGEKYVRINNSEEINGKIAIISNTMYPNQNDSFIETLMLINASVNAGASKVVAFIPYLAYARQDKVFLAGEPVTSDIVLSALRAAGLSCIYTVDIHSPEILERNIECYKNILVFNHMMEHAKKYVNDPIVLAPDKGALHRAKNIAQYQGLEYDYLVKERDRESGIIKIKPKKLDIRGRDIVLVDDIISTGGTIAEASRLLIENGARRIIVCASHGLLIGNAIEKIMKSGVYKVILANTLGIKYDIPFIEYIDIIPYIVEILGSLSK